MVNIKKTDFMKDEFKYLGFILSRHGIRPDPKKVAAIQKIKSPKTRRALQSFLGLVNYIKHTIPKHSETIADLTELTSKNKKFKWCEHHEKAFRHTKKQVMKATMLSYPDFTRKFLIYTDASKKQIGAVIFQLRDDGTFGPPVAYFSKTLSETQKRYTVTEQELLAIVQTLFKHKNLLFGQDIEIFTDHKNLTFQKFSSDRVRRWRLFVEEFGPKITYVPGKANIVADALSRLEISEDQPEEELDNITEQDLYDIDENIVECPIDFQVIKEAQEGLETTCNLRKQQFGRTALWVNQTGKIVVPPSFGARVTAWYHDALVHPGVV